MKTTLSWLKTHLDTDAPLAALVERLVMLGHDVEGVEDRARRHTASRSRSLSAAPPAPFSIPAASAAKPLARKSRWKNGNVV